MGRFKYNSQTGVYRGVGSDPDPGVLDSPNGNVDNGGGSPPGSNPVTVPSGGDYTGWDWEQTLVGVLGLALPNRHDVTAQRWTAIDFNTSGGNDMYLIFDATWRSVDAIGPHHDTFVYLNPNLLTPGGAWDNYFYQPLQALYSAIGGDSGAPNYGGVALNPRTFDVAATEVGGVEEFYNSAAGKFNTLASALQGEASQFKGQAGQAFYQLVDNLYQAANQSYSQMTNPDYANLISSAGEQASGFLLSLWNALAAWTFVLAHSPLGAIYQSLMNHGVIVGSDNNTSFTLANPGSSDSYFGDLTTATAWEAVEADAKILWLNSISATLDPVAASSLHSLVYAYGNVISNAGPLLPPTLTSIAPANPNLDNPDLNSLLNGDLSARSLMNPNNLNTDSPDLRDLVQRTLADLGAGNLNLDNPNVDNPNLGVDTSLGPTTAGTSTGSLTSPVSSLGTGPLGTGPLGTGPLGTGPLGTGPLGTGPLGTGSLGTGPLGTGPVTTGLGTPGTLGAPGVGTGVTGTSRVATTVPPAPLKTALASNAKVQSELRRALALAPATGPLHNALENALVQSNKVKAALNHALAGGVTANAGEVSKALAGNSALQAELRKALGLVPRNSPLHRVLETALADSRKVGHDLNQALSQAGLAVEPSRGILSSPGIPGTGLGPLAGGLGKQGLSASLGGGGGGGGGGGASVGLPAQAGAPVGVSAAAGLAGGRAGLAVSAPPGSVAGSAAVPAAGTQAAAGGSNAVPFFPPMAGQGGAGAAGQQQERERSTWLSEDEEVWGTEPEVGPQVLGRDLLDDDDEADDYEDFAEPAVAWRRRDQVRSVRG